MRVTITTPDALTNGQTLRWFYKGEKFWQVVKVVRIDGVTRATLLAVPAPTGCN